MAERNLLPAWLDGPSDDEDERRKQLVAQAVLRGQATFLKNEYVGRGELRPEAAVVLDNAFDLALHVSDPSAIALATAGRYPATTVPPGDPFMHLHLLRPGNQDLCISWPVPPAGASEPSGGSEAYPIWFTGTLEPCGPERIRE